MKLSYIYYIIRTIYHQHSDKLVSSLQWSLRKVHWLEETEYMQRQKMIFLKSLEAVAT